MRFYSFLKLVADSHLIHLKSGRKITGKFQAVIIPVTKTRIYYSLRNL
jgi:hypothetical protein